MELVVLGGAALWLWGQKNKTIEEMDMPVLGESTTTPAKPTTVNTPIRHTSLRTTGFRPTSIYGNKVHQKGIEFAEMGSNAMPYADTERKKNKSFTLGLLAPVDKFTGGNNLLERDDASNFLKSEKYMKRARYLKWYIAQSNNNMLLTTDLSSTAPEPRTMRIPSLQSHTQSRNLNHGNTSDELQIVHRPNHAVMQRKFENEQDRRVSMIRKSRRWAS